MSYDVAAVRALVPALAAGRAHFDAAGGTQTPAPVIDAVCAALRAPLANRGGVTPGEIAAEDLVLRARFAMADLLSCRPEGVVFGRSATSLTYHLARTLSRSWGPGDEVVVSRLDHDANVRPWVQAARSAGARVLWAGFDPATTEMPVDEVARLLSGRTRLVAVTGASNLVGTRPDLPGLAAATHRAGAWLHVDAVHLTAHVLPDLPASGADSLTCSPYKFLGPHCGVLAAAPERLAGLAPEKLLPATDAVPERFELGTLPYELLAGVSAAVDVLAGLVPRCSGSRRERLAASYTALEEHETELRHVLEAGLSGMPGVVLRSRAVSRTPTLLVTLGGREAEAYRFLARRGIDAPAGSFYALETSRHLGLGDDGGLRIGLAPYTDRGDVDRLLQGLSDFLAG